MQDPTATPNAEAAPRYDSSMEPITECCPPVLKAPLDDEEATRLASWFKVLGDPGRLRLLSLMAARGEACACDLVEPLGLSQPTVSHHLQVLHRAGLVERERRGKWVHYKPVPERLAVLSRIIGS